MRALVPSSAASFSCRGDNNNEKQAIRFHVVYCVGCVVQSLPALTFSLSVQSRRCIITRKIVRSYKYKNESGRKYSQLEYNKMTQLCPARLRICNVRPPYMKFLLPILLLDFGLLLYYNTYLYVLGTTHLLVVVPASCNTNNNNALAR